MSRPHFEMTEISNTDAQPLLSGCDDPEDQRREPLQLNANNDSANQTAAAAAANAGSDDSNSNNHNRSSSNVELAAQQQQQQSAAAQITAAAATADVIPVPSSTPTTTPRATAATTAAQQQPQRRQSNVSVPAATSSQEQPPAPPPADGRNDDDNELVAAEHHLDISAIVAPHGMDLCGHHFTTHQSVGIGTAIIIVVGLALGFGLTPPGKDDNNAGKVISSIIGWIYFNAWTISFFPQLVINYRRKSVIGQNQDYVALNALGFTGYTIFNCCFYFSTDVQKQYQDRFNSKNEVQINDVGFAVFALILTAYNLYQIWSYERGAQRFSKPILIFIAVCISISSIWAILIAAGVRTEYVFQSLDLLYGLGVIKIAVTFIKYIPQILLSYNRKSTVGWNRWNILLDLTGSVLSLGQEILDASMSGHWNSLYGNPVKFGLGFFGMIYDVIMLIQHYCLYAENNEKIVARFDAEQAERAAALAQQQ